MLFYTENSVMFHMTCIVMLLDNKVNTFPFDERRKYDCPKKVLMDVT